MKRLAQNRPALIAAMVAIVVMIGGIAIFSARSPTSSTAGAGGTSSLSPSLGTGTTVAGPVATTIGSDATGNTVASDAPASTDAPPPSALVPNPRVTPPGPTVVVPPGDAPAPPIPAQVNVTGNSGARDGTPVVVRVQADGGSKLYGIEARLCRAGATFVFDADFLPTATGNCIARPLSAGSDAKVEVPVPAPNQSGELTFRVGVGTDAFPDREGNVVNITCGPGNPCQVVVKVQYPNGFGFKTYPVTYG